MLRVGLVGAGIIGRDHLACLRELPEVTIVGVADPATEAATELATLAGADAVGDYRELLDRIDAAMRSTTPPGGSTGACSPKIRRSSTRSAPSEHPRSPAKRAAATSRLF